MDQSHSQTTNNTNSKLQQLIHQNQTLQKELVDTREKLQQLITWIKQIEIRLIDLDLDLPKEILGIVYNYNNSLYNEIENSKSEIKDEDDHDKVLGVGIDFELFDNDHCPSIDDHGHGLNEPFKCTKCPSVLPTFSALQQHQMELHCCWVVLEKLDMDIETNTTKAKRRVKRQIGKTKNLVRSRSSPVTTVKFPRIRMPLTRNNPFTRTNGSFYCPHCDNANENDCEPTVPFPNIQRLLQHKAKKHQEIYKSELQSDLLTRKQEVYYCPSSKCTNLQPFARRNVCEKHIKNVHGNVPPLLLIPREIVQETKPFRISCLGKKTKERNRLIEQELRREKMKEQEEEAKKPKLNCFICSAQIQDAKIELYFDHLNTVHGFDASAILGQNAQELLLLSPKSQDVSCSYCLMSFFCISNLLRHVKALHSEKFQSEFLPQIRPDLWIQSIKVYNSCTTCGQYFPEEVDLERHNQELHCYKCPEINCIGGGVGGGYFKHKSDFLRHLTKCRKTNDNDKASNSGDEDKHKDDEFVCETCGVGFANIFNLRKHKHVHSNERPFPCNFCEFKAKLPLNLRLHMQSKHPTEAGLRSLKVQCEQCGRIFSSLKNKKRHVKEVHENLRTRACEKCGKLFKAQSSLNAHLKAHEKPGGLGSRKGRKKNSRFFPRKKRKTTNDGNISIEKLKEQRQADAEIELQSTSAPLTESETRTETENPNSTEMEV